jgi:PAS domain S-box-containing protein
MRISNISKLITLGVFLLSATSIATNLIALDNFAKRDEAVKFQLYSFETGTQFAKADDYLTDLVRDFVATRDEKYFQAYEFELNVTQTLEKSIDAFKKMGLVPAEIELMEKAKNASDFLIPLEKLAFSARRTGDLKTAINAVYGADYIQNKAIIMNAIHDFRHLITVRLGKKTTELGERANLTATIALFTLIINLIAIVLAVLFFYQRKVVSPLIELTDNTQKLLNGNQKFTFGYQNDKSEIGDLARSLESYSKISHEMESQRRIKQSLLNIDNALITTATYSEFAEVLSSKIAAELNLIYAALYVLDVEYQELKRVGGFCCDNQIDLHFKIGQGLIGQVAQDKKEIKLSFSENQPIKVATSIGEMNVDHVFMLPIILNNEVLGVFEIGSVHSIESNDTNFLEILLPDVAAKLQILSGNIATRELLDETLKQSERMLTQSIQLEEQALEMKDAEAWFKAIIESAPEAILVVNEDGKIILCNRQADIIFGYEHDELLWEMMDVLLIKSIFTMNFDNENIGIRKDGSQFLAEMWLSHLPTVGERGECICVTMRDIKVIKKTEQHMMKDTSSA